MTCKMCLRSRATVSPVRFSSAERMIGSAGQASDAYLRTAEATWSAGMREEISLKGKITGTMERGKESRDFALRIFETTILIAWEM